MNFLKNTKLMRILSLALAAVVAALAIVVLGLATGISPPNSPAPAVKPGGDTPLPPPPAVFCTHEHATPRETAPATCAADGITSYICDECGLTVRKEPIPAVGHDYSEAQATGLCKTCGTKISSKGLLFLPNADATAYTVGRLEHDEAYVVVNGMGEATYELLTPNELAALREETGSELEVLNKFIKYACDGYIDTAVAFNDVGRTDYAGLTIHLNVRYDNVCTMRVFSGDRYGNHTFKGHVEYSLDGEDYKNAGELTGAETLLTFSEPISLKHLRIVIDGTASGIVAFRDITFNDVCDTDLVIPEYYNDKPVTAIGANAYTEKKYIKSVSIPSTIQSIGVGAFSQTEIIKLYYNAGSCADFVGKNWVFYSDSKAPSIDVVFGRAVKHIPERLFYPNNSASDVIPKLRSIRFEAGSKLESIGDYAFYRSPVKSAELPDTLKSIGAHSFEAAALEDIKFGSGLEQIGESAFNYCVNLKNANLDATKLNAIGKNAFKYCSDMSTLTLPETLGDIGDMAFEGCTALTAALLPSHVTSIGSRAFFGCEAVTELVLPKKLKTLGDMAFEGCTALGKITVKATSMSDLPAGNRAFYGAGKSGVTVVIASGVKTIPARLFFSSADATNDLHITSVTIPLSVEIIGRSAFRGTTVDSVVYMGMAAQYDAIAIAPGNTELGRPEFRTEV